MTHSHITKSPPVYTRGRSSRHKVQNVWAKTKLHHAKLSIPLDNLFVGFVTALQYETLCIITSRPTSNVE